MVNEKRGRITLLRDIDNHWLWRDKPFSKGQAWIDMLLMANYAPRKWIMGNTIIPIDRGQFITSQKKLADRWGWGRDRQKVRDFLEFLSNPAPDEPMITKETTKLYTKITILNYNNLQQFATNRTTNKRTKTPATKTQDPCTNKNNNNVKNDNHKDISAFFDYYLLKTNKHYKLTDDKQSLIKKRLSDGFTIGQLKQAVDNFIQDDWEGRKDRMDLIYCIGQQKGKRDNLEHWLNKKPTDPLAKYEMKGEKRYGKR